jgi:hypothetical protein
MSPLRITATAGNPRRYTDQASGHRYPGGSRPEIQRSRKGCISSRAQRYAVHRDGPAMHIYTAVPADHPLENASDPPTLSGAI